MSSIKSKENAAHVIQDDDLYPSVNYAGTASQSVTRAQIETRTHLEGQKMIFNPDDLGVYADTDAVIAATPTGGTIEFINDYDVATHGVIALNKGVTLKGQGWGRTDEIAFPIPGRDGTRITNNGVAPEANCITIHGDISASEDNVMSNIVIRDLYIWHEGTTGYAIDIMNGTRGKVNNVCIEMGYAGTRGLGGIKVSTSGTTSSSATWGYFFDRLWIRNFTERGIYLDQPKGSKNRISNSIIRSDEATALCAIEIYCKDTLVDFCQADVIGAPAIIVRAGTAYARDTSGVIIDNCLCEYDRTMVKAVGDGGDYVVNNLVIRNPISTSNHTSRRLFYFDYCYNSIVEIPLAYGSVAGSSQYIGDLGEFTANTSGNLVKIMGEHTKLDYVDSGVGNKVIIENCTDKQLMRSSYTAGKQYLPMADASDGGLVRSSTTAIEGITGVWQGVGADLINPYGIENCTGWFDADDITNMYTDTAASAVVTADADEVLYWKEKNFSSTGLYFSTLENISGISIGATARITTPGGEEHSVLSDDTSTVIVSGVGGADGPAINAGGPYTTTWVDTTNFDINWNSTGHTYDLTNAVFTVVENTPVYKDDVGGLGVPGILFDGTNDVFRGQDIDIGADGGTIIVVGWCTDETPTTLNSYLGRASGVDGISQDSLVGIMRPLSRLENINFYHPTSGIPVNTGSGFLASRNNAGFNTMNFGMEAEVSAVHAASLTKNATNWQMGANGSVNTMFNGYIQAVVFYNRELTDLEVAQLELYFTCKYKCIVGPT